MTKNRPMMIKIHHSSNVVLLLLLLLLLLQLQLLLVMLLLLFVLVMLSRRRCHCLGTIAVVEPLTGHGSPLLIDVLKELVGRSARPCSLQREHSRRHAEAGRADGHRDNRAVVIRHTRTRVP